MICLIKLSLVNLACFIVKLLELSNRAVSGLHIIFCLLISAYSCAHDQNAPYDMIIVRMDDDARYHYVRG